MLLVSKIANMGRIIEGFRKSIRAFLPSGTRGGIVRFGNEQVTKKVAHELIKHFEDSDSYGFVAFSKNRPIQLHALLWSYCNIARIKAPIHILYCVTSEEFHRAYKELKIELSDCGNIHFHQQSDSGSFKQQVVALVTDMPSHRLGFLVDDNIFIRECRLKAFSALDLRSYVPSLRLSKAISFSYTMNRAVRQPVLERRHGLLEWKWTEGTDEWNYPLSLDGNIFLRCDVLEMLKEIQFSSPNTLESRLQVYNPLFLSRKGACFSEARLINVPCNRVQIDYPNRFGTLSVQELLQSWRSGQRIVVEELRGRVFNSAHVDWAFRFTTRSK